MTAPFTPTHRVTFRGREIPVRITGSCQVNGRTRTRVENEHGTPFVFPPASVRPLETEADIELRFGGLLQDPDAPAEAVNAAMREWREVKGYDEPEFPDGEFGTPFGDTAPYVPGWYEDELERAAEDAAVAMYELQADHTEVGR